MGKFFEMILGALGEVIKSQKPSRWILDIFYFVGIVVLGLLLLVPDLQKWINPPATSTVGTKEIIGAIQNLQQSEKDQIIDSLLYSATQRSKLQDLMYQGSDPDSTNRKNNLLKYLFSNPGDEGSEDRMGRLVKYLFADSHTPTSIDRKNELLNSLLFDSSDTTTGARVRKVVSAVMKDSDFRAKTDTSDISTSIQTVQKSQGEIKSRINELPASIFVQSDLKLSIASSDRGYATVDVPEPVKHFTKKQLILVPKSDLSNIVNASVVSVDENTVNIKMIQQAKNGGTYLYDAIWVCFAEATIE